METSRAERPKMGSPMARKAWAKVSMGWLRRNEARLVVHFGDAEIIAREESAPGSPP